MFSFVFLPFPHKYKMKDKEGCREENSTGCFGLFSLGQIGKKT
jgi:hypothetical protein